MNEKVPAADTQRDILVVGDRSRSRDLVTMVLRRLHYDVDPVATAAGALASFDPDRHAVALVDGSLPDMEGVELAARLHAGSRADRPLQVIMLADRPDPPPHDGPVRDYLPKPVQIHRLLHLVRECLAPPKRARQTVPVSPPVVDMAHLRSFTEGDRRLEEELVTLFLSTAGVYLERLGEALETEAEWSSVAHALKGASANLGARQLAELAARAEVEGPDPGRLRALADALEAVRALLAPDRPGDVTAPRTDAEESALAP